jgi:hypothetical protein
MDEYCRTDTLRCRTRTGNRPLKAATELNCIMLLRLHVCVYADITGCEQLVYERGSGRKRHIWNERTVQTLVPRGCALNLWPVLYLCLLISSRVSVAAAVGILQEQSGCVLPFWPI